MQFNREYVHKSEIKYAKTPLQRLAVYSILIQI